MQVTKNNLTYAQIAERQSKLKTDARLLAPTGAKCKGPIRSSYRYDAIYNASMANSVKRAIYANEHSIKNLCSKCNSFVSKVAKKKQPRVDKHNILCEYCLEIKK